MLEYLIKKLDELKKARQASNDQEERLSLARDISLLEERIVHLDS